MTAALGQALVQDDPQPVDQDIRKTISSEVPRDNPAQGNLKASDIANSKVLAERDPTPEQLLPKANVKQPINPVTEPTSKIQVVENQNWQGERLASSGSGKRRAFVGGVPFLAHHLNIMEPWIQRPYDPAKDFDEDGRAVLRLELAPVSMAKRFPSLELFVVAGKAAKGPRPLLKVIKVSAIHHENHFTVQCPCDEVDVRFSKTLKQDLIFPGSAHVGVVVSLMNTLRSYLGNAHPQGPSDWLFLPFVTMPIHHTLQNVSRQLRKVTGQKMGRRLEQESPDPGVTKMEYILRTVDVVDVDSRTIPVYFASTAAKKQNSKSKGAVASIDYCLNHITYTGADAARQELRLTERSVLCPPALIQPHIPAFVKAALKLANRLSENPLTLRPGQDSGPYLAEVAEADNQKIKVRAKEKPQRKKKALEKKSSAAPEDKAGESIPVAKKGGSVNIPAAKESSACTSTAVTKKRKAKKSRSTAA